MGGNVKLFVAFMLLLVGISAQASIEDLKCEGKDRQGRQITILWDGWKDNRGTGRVDLTLTVNGQASRTYSDLYVYIPNEEGFDYGVTSAGGDFMLHLVYPYQVSNPKEVRGDFYYGKRFDLNSRVYLSCRPTRIPKRY
jgi:hypothetical protein